MALNPKTIKALFGKLAPYADDAARLAANYGDDVAKAAANYGDDALRAVDKVDDFIPPATLPDFNAQAALKERLIDKRLPYDHYTHVEPPAAANDKIGDYIQRFSETPAWGRFPRSTKTLGNVTTDLFSNDPIVPKGVANLELPNRMDTSDLVVDDLRPLGMFDKQFTLRPHHNTALGRYYRSHMPKIDTVRKNPPLKKIPTFRDAADYEDMRNYLDTRDAVKRVNFDIGDGSVSNTSNSDIFRYIDNLPNLNYYDDYDENDLSALYEVLKRRKNTNETFQKFFGATPKALPTTPEYDLRIQALEDMFKKFK